MIIFYILLSLVLSACVPSNIKSTHQIATNEIQPTIANNFSQTLFNSNLPEPINTTSLTDDETNQLNQDLILFIKNNQSPNNIKRVWWAKYQQASLWSNKNPIRSCELYQTLAKQKEFPLNSIAWLKTLQLCSANKVNLSLFNVKKLEQDKWLRSLVLESLLEYNVKNNNTKGILAIYEKQFSYARDKNTKKEIIIKALELALKTNDKQNTAIYKDTLRDLDPLYFPDIKLTNKLRLAYEFRKKRQFPRARSLYTQVFNNKNSTIKNKIKALKGIRICFKLEHKTSDYLKATYNLAQYVEKIFKSSKKRFAKTYHEITLLYARTLWTVGQTSSAVKVILNTEKTLKGLLPLDTVYWLLSRISEEKKDYNKALEWISLSEKECKSSRQPRKRTCSLKNKISWHKSWFLRKNGQHQEAITLLEKLIKNPASDYYNKYLFWLAQNYLTINKPLIAHDYLETLITSDPMGYYGLLAQRELYKTISLNHLKSENNLIALERKKLSEPLSFHNSQDGTFSTWLISVGEFDLSSAFLNKSSKENRKKKVRDFNFWSEVFSHYSKTNDYLSLYIVLNRMPAKLKKSLINHSPNLLFPQPFKHDVDTAAEKFNIPSELIYAIMRQESAFNKKARSHADAFGLMQLLPSVAKKEANRINFSYQSRADLFIPYSNINLGTSFLSKLWNKYDGQFILLSASYNAAEKAIAGWVKHRYEGAPLEFIEEVPYEETRNYIKLVLRNFIFYKTLNSSQKEIPFPEWCLKGIHKARI